ncbi:hypothetical protein EYF80_020854 [Liparis tanakae]|uniref:Uncharacterized protein n=1 Tax=Liparis tanakae TaxID=230148 RepID=A0A4Z2HVK0_9TELE|nr:hypothetical protein EYF80_020854 [Liparis tanakae]
MDPPQGGQVDEVSGSSAAFDSSPRWESAILTCLSPTAPVSSPRLPGERCPGFTRDRSVPCGFEPHILSLFKRMDGNQHDGGNLTSCHGATAEMITLAEADGNVIKAMFKSLLKIKGIKRDLLMGMDEKFRDT